MAVPPDPISVAAASWIVRIKSGRATREEHEALKAWRASDPRCDAAFARLEEMWAELGGIEQDPQTGLARAPKIKGKAKGRSKKLLLILALCGIVSAFAYWQTLEEPADFTTDTAEMRTFVLADGSKATLNARSALDVKITEDSREIVVRRGQVFFEVARDATRPFRVAADSVTATALGTAFEVIRRDRSNVAVGVVEHAVSVETLGRTNERARVSEGQRVQVRGGVIEPVVNVNPDSLASWRRGVLVAEGMSLADVIAELRPYHPGLIVVAGVAADRIDVHAVLRLSDPIRSLDTLAAGLNIRIRHATPYLTIVTPD